MYLSMCLSLCVLISWIAMICGQLGCNVTNKFGEDCHYSCHCKADTACSQNGSCSEGCQSGWFGPGCQYKDLLPLSTQKMTLNIKTVNYKFQWTLLFKFTWMKIQLKDPVVPMSMNISFSKREVLQFCEKSIVTQIDVYTYNLHCDAELFIDSLTIDTEKIDPWKAIYVSGGLGDTFGLPAGNSVTIWSSPFAVEGSTNGYNCTTSLLNTTFVDVNNKDVLLNHYMFSNLDVQEKFRLVKYSQSEVYTFKDSGQLAFMYLIKNETIQLMTYKAIRSNVFNAGAIISLCEVPLFEEMQCAEIPRFRIQCIKASNCLKPNDACPYSVGKCLSGCAVGFTDECCTSYKPIKKCFPRRRNRHYIDKTKVL